MSNEKKSKSADPNLPSRPPRDSAPPGQLSLLAAYEKYRAIAETLDATSVRAMRADLSIALQNAERAIAWLPDKRQQIAGLLPTVNYVSLFELPDVLRAALHAQSLMDAEPPVAGASTASKARKKAAAGRPFGPSEMRDRLWSLALVDYANLWRVGAFLFGPEAISQYVPPLLAMPVKRKSTVPPATD
jgi:hypothetical protein